MSTKDSTVSREPWVLLFFRLDSKVSGGILFVVANAMVLALLTGLYSLFLRLHKLQLELHVAASEIPTR